MTQPENEITFNGITYIRKDIPQTVVHVKGYCHHKWEEEDKSIYDHNVFSPCIEKALICKKYNKQDVQLW